MLPGIDYRASDTEESDEDFDVERSSNESKTDVVSHVDSQDNFTDVNGMTIIVLTCTKEPHVRKST